MTIFGSKMAHNWAQWPAWMTPLCQNMLYGIIYQPSMLWCCHSCSTIKITSVNGQYMVKMAIFGLKMAIFGLKMAHKLVH